MFLPVDNLCFAAVVRSTLKLLSPTPPFNQGKRWYQIPPRFWFKKRPRWSKLTNPPSAAADQGRGCTKDTRKTWLVWNHLDAEKPSNSTTGGIHRCRGLARRGTTSPGGASDTHLQPKKLTPISPFRKNHSGTTTIGGFPHTGRSSPHPAPTCGGHPPPLRRNAHSNAAPPPPGIVEPLWVPV